MRKMIILLFAVSLLFTQPAVLALETEEAVPPKWEDYVPEKYQNPRKDFTRGSSIAEMSTGIALTALIITFPVGVPMICHGTTKFKHVSYRDKKEKFEKGLAYAETIESTAEKQAYYDKLPSKCGLKESKKNKILKKRAKEQAKADKKAAKAAQKLNKENSK